MADTERRDETTGEGSGRGASRRISSVVSLETLKLDFEELTARAIDMGASHVQVIPANRVRVDERVRLKCSVPVCGYYGKNAHCPPHAPDIAFMRTALGRYTWALLYAINVLPPGDFAEGSRKQARPSWFRKNLEIAGAVESMAFGKGYYLAAAFCQGSCKAALCGEAEGCRVLEGKGCAHPLQSRPSMESVGIDVFGLVAGVGWDIYPVYRSVDPDMVPQALSVGIVFLH